MQKTIDLQTIYNNLLSKHHRLIDRLYKMDVHLIHHQNDNQTKKSQRKIESIFKKNLSELRQTKNLLITTKHV